IAGKARRSVSVTWRFFRPPARARFAGRPGLEWKKQKPLSVAAARQCFPALVLSSHEVRLFAIGTIRILGAARRRNTIVVIRAAAKKRIATIKAQSIRGKFARANRALPRSPHSGVTYPYKSAAQQRQTFMSTCRAFWLP